MQDKIVFCGKAFCVWEDLRLFSENHKGKTVHQALKEIKGKKQKANKEKGGMKN